MKIYLSMVALLVTQVCFANVFKVVPGLEKDVRFWKFIFGKYHSGECVLHDPERLDMVYGVIKVPQAPSQRESKIDKYKSKISSYLEKLASGSPVESHFGKVLYQAIPRDLRRASFLREAMPRIRCQIGNADGFRKSLARSKELLPRLKQRMRANGLPEELAYLPHVESGFNFNAYSKVGASGLWQLMPAAAREAGLTVGRWRDDRRSVDKSTTAAIRILKRNYRKVESWPLALTGYNYGINGVARGVKKLGTRDYVDFRKAHVSPSFGFAGRNFYPSFLAVLELARGKENSPDLGKKGSGLLF